MEQPNSEIIIYQSPEGNIKIMAMLFGKGRTAITEHIQKLKKIKQ